MSVGPSKVPLERTSSEPLQPPHDKIASQKIDTEKSLQLTSKKCGLKLTAPAAKDALSAVQRMAQAQGKSKSGNIFTRLMYRLFANTLHSSRLLHAPTKQIEASSPSLTQLNEIKEFWIQGEGRYKDVPRENPQFRYSIGATGMTFQTVSVYEQGKRNGVYIPHDGSAPLYNGKPISESNPLPKEVRDAIATLWQNERPKIDKMKQFLQRP